MDETGPGLTSRHLSTTRGTTTPPGMDQDDDFFVAMNPEDPLGLMDEEDDANSVYGLLSLLKSPETVRTGEDGAEKVHDDVDTSGVENAGNSVDDVTRQVNKKGSLETLVPPVGEKPKSKRALQKQRKREREAAAKAEEMPSGMAATKRTSSEANMGNSGLNPANKSKKSAQGNFAGAKTVREEFPYLLKIYAGRKDRLPITKETWEAIWSMIINQHKCQLMMGESLPADFDIKKHGYDALGKCGLITPDNEATQKWVKETLELNPIGRNFFRAWTKGESGDDIFGRMFLPKDYDTWSGKELETAIKKLNPIPGVIEFSSEAKVKTGPGRMIRFRLDKVAADWIHLKKGDIRLGCTRAEMKVDHKQDEKDVPIYLIYAQ